MQNPFVGTWVLKVEKSEFDANHHPRAGTMIIEFDAEGYYLQTAASTKKAKNAPKGRCDLSRMAKNIPFPISRD